MKKDKDGYGALLLSAYKTGGINEALGMRKA